MGRPLNHRFTRWLRFAAVWALLSHDAVAPWMALPLYAQNPDGITIGVTPLSPAAPDAVTDLLASANPVVQGQISLSWTAPQGNAGGVPINNQTVAAYSIHYATFSVASLSGDTTSWWTSTSAGSVLLQPPTYVPKPPGQLESYAFSGLIPGATYYFGLKSISQSGVTSPIDTESASPTLQANAVATIFATTSGGTPLRPNGLVPSSSGGQFTLQWHPVTVDTNQQPISIREYDIYRYDAIGSTPSLAGRAAPNNLTFTDTVGGLTYFYRLFAVSIGSVASSASDYVDSSAQLNRYCLAPTESNTRIVIPGVLAAELNRGNNGSTDDYEIVATHQPQNENPTTLKSYLFNVQNARTGQLIPNFAFSQPIAQVQLSYALPGGVIGFQPLANSLNNFGSQAQSVAQVISLYWFNGAGFVRLGGTVLLQNQALVASAKNLGLYEIQVVSVPTQFSLTRGSPYPRVITPNDASQNNRVFWFFDNPANEEVTGTIYDIRGARVRDLSVNGLSPTANSIVWDGRDMNGAVVPSGVYLYKIQAGKDKQTGTVVVAR
jgi:hypothetical protein